MAEFVSDNSMIHSGTTTRNLKRAYKWMMLALGVAIGLNVTQFLKFDPRPPIDGSFRMVTANSPVPVGSDLIVTAIRHKVRDDCPVTSLREIVNIDGVPFQIDSVFGAGLPANTAEDTVVFGTSALPIGQYILNVRLVFHCPGKDFEIAPPALPFRVADPYALDPQVEQQVLEMQVDELRGEIEELSKTIEVLK